MTKSELARILIEHEDEAKLPRKISVFVNRLLMRMFSVPSLMNFLADVGTEKDETKPNTWKVQLDFQKLPKEVVTQLVRLIASPRPPTFYRYIKNGAARTGIELEVSVDDFPGKDFDYAG